MSKQMRMNRLAKTAKIAAKWDAANPQAANEGWDITFEDGWSFFLHAKLGAAVEIEETHPEWTIRAAA